MAIKLLLLVTLYMCLVLSLKTQPYLVKKNTAKQVLETLIK